MLYICHILIFLSLINELHLWLASLSLRNRAALHHLWRWVLWLRCLVYVALGWLSIVDHHLLLLLLHASSSIRARTHRSVIILILRRLLIHFRILDVCLWVVLRAQRQAFSKLLARILIVAVFVPVAAGESWADTIRPTDSPLLPIVIRYLCLLHLFIFAVVNWDGHIRVNRAL